MVELAVGGTGDVACLGTGSTTGGRFWSIPENCEEDSNGDSSVVAKRSWSTICCTTALALW